MIICAPTNPWQSESYDYEYSNARNAGSIMEDEKWLSNVLSMCNQDYGNAMFDPSIVLSMCESVAANMK